MYLGYGRFGASATSFRMRDFDLRDTGVTVEEVPEFILVDDIARVADGDDVTAQSDVAGDADGAGEAVVRVDLERGGAGFGHGVRGEIHSEEGSVEEDSLGGCHLNLAKCNIVQ